MHRNILLAIILGLLSISVSYGKTNVTVGDTTFLLASEEGNNNGKLREYLPIGENFDHWFHLVAVREFPKLDDPKKYIAAFAQQYHAKFPQMQFQVAQDVSTGDWTIDFLEYPTSGTLQFLEWNFFRAHKSPRGLMVYQHAVRFYYSGDMQPAADSFKETRKKMLGTLWAARFEEKEELNHSSQPPPSKGG
jgi:hypothetical protein